MKVLRAHRQSQTREAARAGDAWVESGYVFTNADGSPLNPDYLIRRFRQLVGQSGLPPVRLHDLRYGAATLAHAAGADLKTVQEQLGHTSIVLTALYRAKGLSEQTARTVAEELTAHDAFAAHVEVELGIDPTDLTNPWQAALASAAAFITGALLPLVAILAPPSTWRVPVTFVAVLVALAVTGGVSARLGGTSRRAAVARVVIGGALGMLVTYSVGYLFHTAGI